MIRLVDLSALVHPIWHTHQDVMALNPNVVSEVCASTVLDLCAGHQAAVCVDRKPTLRLDIDPNYKANREPKPPEFSQQLRLCVQRLRDAGRPIWQAEGCEADDIIASAVGALLDDDRAANQPIEIVSPDKDLMALVDDAKLVVVRVIGRNGEPDQVFDEEAVKQKYGVLPKQMPDWLCLTGDSSDNIRGAKGYGPKTAAALLKDMTLDEVMAKLRSVTLEVTPVKRSALLELQSRLPVVRNVVELIDDIPIDIDQLFAHEPKETPVVIQKKTAADQLDEMLDGPVTEADSIPAGTIIDEPKPKPEPEPEPESKELEFPISYHARTRLAEALAGMDGHAKRDCRNQHGGYDYASADSIFACVRLPLAKVGLAIWQQQVELEFIDVPGKGDKPSRWMKATYEFALTPDGQAPAEGEAERVTVGCQLLGAQSFGAIRTYALKYWLRGKCLISTGDRAEDIDADAHRL